MTTEIVALNARDLGYVMAHLRREDVAEARAMMGDMDPAQLTRATLYNTHTGWIAREDRGATWRPVAAWGVQPVTARCWRVWLVATRRWPTVHRQVTEHIIQVLVPALIEAGVWRLEALSVEGATQAQKWMRRMGAVEEGPPMAWYGQNGETMHRLVWLRADLFEMEWWQNTLASRVATSMGEAIAAVTPPEHKPLAEVRNSA